MENQKDIQKFGKAGELAFAGGFHFELIRLVWIRWTSNTAGSFGSLGKGKTKRRIKGESETKGGREEQRGKKREED